MRQMLIDMENLHLQHNFKVCLNASVKTTLRFHMSRSSVYLGYLLTILLVLCLSQAALASGVAREHWEIQRPRLSANSVSSDAQNFGRSVALSGRWLFVSADLGAGTEVVCVYRKTKNGWRKSQLLKPARLHPVKGEASGFGDSIVLTGNIAFISGFDMVVGGQPRGAVFVYVNRNGRWVPVQVLSPKDGSYSGEPLSYNGHTLFVGDSDADVGGDQSQGAVYAFTKRDGKWQQAAKIVAKDGAAWDYFGDAIATSRGLLVVVADIALNRMGKAYIYKKSGNHWKNTKVITGGKQVGGRFSCVCGVATNGRDIFLGAASDELTPGLDIWDHPPKNDSGVGEILEMRQVHGRWQSAEKITPRDRNKARTFGHLVYVKRHMIFIGAPRASISKNGYWNGIVYVFQRIGSRWEQTGRLNAGHPKVPESFGSSLAISNHLLVVGAPSAIVGGEERGAVYFFELKRLH